MRNYEIIKKIYERCPDAESFTNGGSKELTREQLFDRCLDIVDLIESERPEIAKSKKKKLYENLRNHCKHTRNTWQNVFLKF